MRTLQQGNSAAIPGWYRPALLRARCDAEGTLDDEEPEGYLCRARHGHRARMRRQLVAVPDSANVRHDASPGPRASARANAGSGTHPRTAATALANDL
jgi:hypothetical protein